MKLTYIEMLTHLRDSFEKGLITRIEAAGKMLDSHAKASAEVKQHALALNLTYETEVVMLLDVTRTLTGFLASINKLD